ncbi:MAG TPA: phosphoribosylamine--glycine ligase, partial [Muricauda sp.]|nr:phosphoribosylamine--glycine ligase [Allomuricauda sp.]
MNILVLGSGGREHAISLKISQSPKTSNLFVAPGNAGTSQIATNVEVGVNDFEAIKQLVLKESIELVVVGPEDPLVNGVHDFFLKDTELNAVPVIGPEKAAAELEGSKEFAKEFMMRHNIPTAAYESFTSETLEKGYTFLE